MTLEQHMARAVIAEQERAKAIIAAGAQYSASRREVDEALQSNVTAADFARHHEIESLARQIATAGAGERLTRLADKPT